MALEMSDATYGRSKQGTEALIKNIENDIDAAIKAIDGNKYTELKKIVNNNWSGADKNAFINDLDKKRESLKENLKSLKKKARTVIEADYNNFINSQKSIYKAK